MSSKIPEKLLVQYQNTLKDKMLQLENLIQTIESQKDKASLEALRAFVHKMGGSAGTYGYPEVSILCKEWEKILMEKIEKDVCEDVMWIHQLKKLPCKIKKAFKLETEHE